MLWIAAAVILALTARQIVRARRSTFTDVVTRGSGIQVAQTEPALAMFDSDSLDSAAAHVIAHDAFRLDRKPAAVAFSTAPVGITAPPVPAAAAIRIELQGTIGGPPWRGIISGVPGHDGTVVVSAGDTLGGVSIRRVKRDSITVRVKDSTWTVALPKAGA